mgnify:CR=1 FL=1
MRLTQSELRTIFDQALKNNQAFILDWKFPVEDIVFNVKQVLPELDIDDKGEKQVKGDWIQTMVLDGKEYSFKADSNTLILDVISSINKHLKKDNQILVFFDTKDDEYCFILINLSELPSYLEKGFIEI